MALDLVATRSVHGWHLAYGVLISQDIVFPLKLDIMAYIALR